MAAVRRFFPGLEAAVCGEAAPPPFDIKLETAASGEMTFSAAGVLVHSNRDPRREAVRLAESLSGGGPLVFFGFGLGYAVEEAARRFPARPIIVIERHPSLLKLALESRDLTGLLSGGALIIVPGGSGGGGVSALDLAAGRAEGAPKSPPYIVKNRALTRLDAEWYGALEGRIAAWAAKDDVNAATLKKFGRRWVRNLGRNMDAIRDLPGVSRLEGMFNHEPHEPHEQRAAKPAVSPIPVFLAAAGPGLDDCGPLLAEIARRCVVVAVDTSLRFCLKRGVCPDFVVSVDPQFWNARHLDRAYAPRAALAAESAVYPPALRLVGEGAFRAGFLCRSLFPLGRFIEDKTDPKGELAAGGSVATTAWDFCRLLLGPAGGQSGGMIWIAGLDLAFPGLKTHFRGAAFEEGSHASSRRFAPAETWSVKALRDGHPFPAPASGGGTVLTDKRLSLYAAWFENRLRMSGGIKSYRLDGGKGIAIAHMESGTYEALLALPPRRGEIDGRLEAAYASLHTEFYGGEAAAARAARYEKARAALASGLERIGRIAGEAASVAERGPAAGVLEKLDRTNKAIAESEVKEAAGFLFPPPGELEEGDASPGGKLAAYLRYSARFYRALADAVSFNLQFIGL